MFSCSNVIFSLHNVSMGFCFPQARKDEKRASFAFSHASYKPDRPKTFNQRKSIQALLRDDETRRIIRNTEQHFITLHAATNKFAWYRKQKGGSTYRETELNHQQQEDPRNPRPSRTVLNHDSAPAILTPPAG